MAQAAPSGAAITLRLSNWWGDTLKPHLPILEKKLNVKIQQETADWNDYFTKLLTQFTGGVAPDLPFIAEGKIGPFVTAGLLQPIDQALKDQKVDMTQFAVDLVPYQYNGTLPGLPIELDPPVVCAINVDLIKKQGFNVPHPWPFWGTDNFDNFSWNDLIDNFKAVTKTGSSGDVEIWGDATGHSDFGPVNWYAIFENGGQLFDRYDFKETKTLIDSPEAISAFRMTSDLVVKHKVAPPPGKADVQNFGFGMWKAQKAVGVFGFDSYAAYGAPKDIGFEWHFIMQPHAGAIRALVNTMDLICVNPKSSHLDAAQKFALAFETDNDFWNSLIADTLTVPAFNPGGHTSAVTDPHKQEALKIYLARIPNFSECKTCTAGVKFEPGSKGRLGDFVDNTVTAALQAVVTGQKPVDQAIKEAAKTIDDELAKQKPA